MTECNGQPVAKVSDSPGKTISKDPGYLRYLRQVFGLEPAEKPEAAPRSRCSRPASCSTCSGAGWATPTRVFLLPLEREFGWTRSQLTGVYSVYLLVNGFTAPLVGLVFDRLGPRWVYGAGIALPRRGVLPRRRRWSACGSSTSSSACWSASASA